MYYKHMNHRWNINQKISWNFECTICTFILIWWQSCKWCVGYLVSCSATFIPSRKFWYLLKCSAADIQTNSFNRRSEGVKQKIFFLGSYEISMLKCGKALMLQICYVCFKGYSPSYLLRILNTLYVYWVHQTKKRLKMHAMVFFCYIV